MRASAKYLVKNEYIDRVKDIIQEISHIEFCLHENLYNGLYWSIDKLKHKDIFIRIILNTDHDGGEGSEIIDEPIYEAYPMEAIIVDIACVNPAHPLFLYLSDHPELFVQLEPISISAGVIDGEEYEAFGPVPERFR